MKRFHATVATLIVVALAHPLAALNLAENAGFENVDASGKADHWTPLTFGSKAAFTVDSQIKHSGGRSLRIDATDPTRSYICTPWLLVAPGEKFLIGAWARIAKVPPGEGTTIVIAEFEGASGENVNKIDVARPTAGWQHLSGRVAVPASATAMRLRLGFSYAKGTCWWDDVSIEPERTLVARADLPADRLYPADGGVRVIVLNRAAEHRPVQVCVELAGRKGCASLQLDGSGAQRVLVPVRIETAGRRELRIQLFPAGRSAAEFSGEPAKIVVPPPVTLLPLSPTHWAAEDGEPQIEGQVELALPKEEDLAGRVRLEIVTMQGQEAASQPMTHVRASGFSPFHLYFGAMPVGRYRAVLVVEPKDGARQTAEQPWEVIAREKARVTLNDQGFPVVGGHALFPLGMFNSGRFEESAAAGFNVTHAYNAARVQPGRRPDDQRVKNFLDDTQAAGMHALLMVPLEFAYAGEWDAFRRRIRMLRNHPALLAWDEEEGLARGSMPIESLARMRQILREEDSNHPFMVGDACDVIHRVTDRGRLFPAQYMDLGMWWWYPLPLQKRAADALEGESASSGLVLDPPEFLTKSHIPQPIWTGVQAYKKAKGRYPTPAEYRAQAYIGICAGAKGLMWYGASVTGGLFLAPTEGHWDELKAVVAELRDLMPFLLAPAQKTPQIAPADAPISLTLRKADGRTLQIAVNRGTSPIDCTFSFPGKSASNPIPVRGEHRSLTLDRGRLRDHFEPLAVHLYELPGE